MWTVLIRQALAVEPALPPQAELEVPGMADLHLHQWANEAFGGRFLGGMPAGSPRRALTADKSDNHATYNKVAGARPLAYGMGHELADDIRKNHLDEGLTLDPTHPYFFGWPTPDSVAHQQVWEGWLRLAHEGLPLAWFCETSPEKCPDITRAVQTFRETYAENMKKAARAGFAGLNLVVVPLGGSHIGCVGARGRSKADAPVCSDMEVIERQYEDALYWASQNTTWVTIPTTPEEAQAAIEAGKLAVVLSVEGADFLQDYPRRAETLAGDESESLQTDVAAQEFWVKSAFREWFADHPLVRTVQLVHQLDNPFAGAAVIDDVLVSAAATRLPRRGYDPCATRSGDTCQGPAATDAAALWAHALAWTAATRTAPDGPSALGTRLGGAKMNRLRGMDDRVPRSEDAWPGGDPNVHIQRSRLGLTTHGEWLVDVLVEEKILIDASHLGDRAMVELDAYLPPEIPLYLSHAIPRDIQLVPRELSVTDATLAIVAKRKGVAGVRTQDDYFLTSGSTNPYLQVMANYDCQGTTLAFAAAAHHIHQKVGAIAFGSDLNGFTNHSAPAGMLRAAASEKRPCALAVGSVGSEIGTRGVAHVGLLPQLAVQVESAVTFEPGQKPESLDLDRGAANFITTWARLVPFDRDTVAPEPDTADPAPDAPPVSRLLAMTAETTLDRYGDRPTTDFHLDHYTLPRMRAIEGTLPYVASGLVLPQIPTTMGLLLGAESYTAYPDFGPGLGRRPMRLLTKRCWQIWGRKGGTCGEMENNTEAVENGKIAGNTHDRGFGNEDWSREFPGPFESYDKVAGEVFVADRPPLPASAISRASWDFAVTFYTEVQKKVTSQAASQKRSGGALGACYDDASFIALPVPGFPGGAFDDEKFEQLNEHYRGRGGTDLLILEDGKGRGYSCYAEALRIFHGGNDVMYPGNVGDFRTLLR